MNDDYRIITPENVELDYKIADIGSRFIAVGIDMLIQIIALTGIGVAMDKLKLYDLHSEIDNIFTSTAGAVLIALSFLVLIGYYIILETVFNGQTVGKRIVNIRVRKEGGYALSFWDVLLRNIIRLVDFLPFFYGVGFVTMFMNKKAKRLGDFAAGTIVVREVFRKNLAEFLYAQNFTRPENILEDYTPSNPWINNVLPHITQEDYLLMKKILSRQKDLAYADFVELAYQAVKKIIAGAYNNDSVLVMNTDVVVVLKEIVMLYEKTYSKGAGS